MERKVRIFLDAAGRFEIAIGKEGSQAAHKRGLLPAADVESLEVAENLRTTTCRLSRQDGETYHLPMVEGDLDCMMAAGEMLKQLAEHRKRGVTGEAAWAPFINYKAKWGLL